MGQARCQIGIYTSVSDLRTHYVPHLLHTEKKCSCKVQIMLLYTYPDLMATHPCINAEKAHAALCTAIVT